LFVCVPETQAPEIIAKENKRTIKVERRMSYPFPSAVDQINYETGSPRQLPAVPATGCASRNRLAKQAIDFPMLETV